MLQKNMTPGVVQRGKQEEVKPEAESCSWVTAQPIKMKSLKDISWGPHDSKARQDFFLLNLVLYLFGLYPLVSESLISIFLCKYCFNSKISVVLGDPRAERTLETSRCMVSIRINVFHIMKAYRRIACANSRPWAVPTAPHQQLTWTKPALPSSGVGQWPLTDGPLLQNTSCRKVYLKVLGKAQSVI